MLSVDNINVFYGQLQALWDVSFEVKEGETVALIGSNGAGKTTILKTICGLLRPKSGSINFLGVNIAGLPPERIVPLGVIYTPEGRRLFPYMTVLENLEMGAYTKSARKKVNENLKIVFEIFPILKERRNQKAGTLSGGEGQMLAIARALMANPKLLMMDEPSFGLSPKLTSELFNLIKKLNEDLGITIFLVEQNVHYALELSQRAYVLETGRITLSGSSRQIANNEHVKKAYLGI